VGTRRLTAYLRLALPKLAPFGANFRYAREVIPPAMKLVAGFFFVALGHLFS